MMWFVSGLPFLDSSRKQSETILHVCLDACSSPELRKMPDLLSILRVAAVLRDIFYSSIPQRQTILLI